MLKRNRILLIVVVSLTLKSFIAFASPINSEESDIVESSTTVTESIDPCVSISNSFNNEGKCDCIQGYYMEDGVCHKYATNPEDSVYSAAGCALVPLTEYSYGTCDCIDNHYKEHDACYKYADRAYDSVFSSRGCNRLSYTKFVDNKCHCIAGYYYENEQCHSYATHPGDSTDSAIGCEMLPGTEYIQDSSTCECVSGQYAEEGKCYLYASRPYESDIHSEKGCEKLANTKFIYQKCQCIEGYYLEGDQCQSINSKSSTSTQLENHKTLYIEHPKFLVIGRE